MSKSTKANIGKKKSNQTTGLQTIHSFFSPNVNKDCKDIPVNVDDTKAGEDASMNNVKTAAVVTPPEESCDEKENEQLGHDNRDNTVLESSTAASNRISQSQCAIFQDPCINMDDNWNNHSTTDKSMAVATVRNTQHPQPMITSSQYIIGLNANDSKVQSSLTNSQCMSLDNVMDLTQPTKLKTTTTSNNNSPTNSVTSVQEIEVDHPTRSSRKRTQVEFFKPEGFAQTKRSSRYDDVELIDLDTSMTADATKNGTNTAGKSKGKGKPPTNLFFLSKVLFSQLQ